jgi:hypothetical protein
MLENKVQRRLLPSKKQIRVKNKNNLMPPTETNRYKNWNITFLGATTQTVPTPPHC